MKVQHALPRRVPIVLPSNVLRIRQFRPMSRLSCAQCRPQSGHSRSNSSRNWPNEWNVVRHRSILPQILPSSIRVRPNSEQHWPSRSTFAPIRVGSGPVSAKLGAISSKCGQPGANACGGDSFGGLSGEGGRRTGRQTRKWVCKQFDRNRPPKARIWANISATGSI